MERFDKIAKIENQVEALCLKEELQSRGIPHAIYSNYDLAYDGLFQFSAGWGRVEGPLDRKEEILQILDEIRRENPPAEEQDEHQQDEYGRDEDAEE